MLSVGTTFVSPVQKVFTVRTRPLIRYHALRVTTALHMLHHVIHVLLDIVVPMLGFYRSSARQVTIAKRQLQLVHHVNQVSTYVYFHMLFLNLTVSVLAFANHRSKNKFV